jgi:hypothetical protein
MKISELRNCDYCSGATVPLFYVIRISAAMLTQGANSTLGLNQHFGGNLKLAELFSPTGGEDVLIFGDEDPALLTTLFICQGCMMAHFTLLLMLIEKAADEDPDPEAVDRS